ncbi:FadR/GntR family transcriptional regulator [Piscinibacter sakaiensis]|uniref:FadR/GntR family transcriptional regulator n=1 Tax=Piscinibacter sakaiensis TaxID=1547922 RepID=UPI003AAFC750
MLDPIKPDDNRRLYQRIADQIRSLILAGEYRPGTRLPPERELAQQLGVSRPSVREALIALEIQGNVEIRMGAGVYVCAPPERADPSTVPMGESPIELMQARYAIEGTVIEMACALATPPQLRSLAQSIEAMRLAIFERREPWLHDREFHVGIATITGNSVLVRLVGDMFDERHSPISSKLRGRAENTQTWTDALHEHEAVYRMMEKRDVLEAQTAMRTHLSASQRRWVAVNHGDWP